MCWLPEMQPCLQDGCQRSRHTKPSGVYPLRRMYESLSDWCNLLSLWVFKPLKTKQEIINSHNPNHWIISEIPHIKWFTEPHGRKMWMLRVCRRIAWERKYAICTVYSWRWDEEAERTGIGRTVMRTAMDRIRVVRTNLPISQQISPQTNPQTKLLTAITKSSSTEKKSLHNM